MYFSGSTPWGNRVDTSKEDVQNMLIDACKLLIREYHVDGFRFDATHHNDYMEFTFLDRLAQEVKGFKPNVILIVENLPNQSDLNRQGYDGCFAKVFLHIWAAAGEFQQQAISNDLIDEGRAT